MDEHGHPEQNAALAHLLTTGPSATTVFTEGEFALSFPLASGNEMGKVYNSNRNSARPGARTRTPSTRRWSSGALPSTAATDAVDHSLDTVIWLNVGTITGTPGADEFCTELEARLLTTFESWSSTGRVRPEWSKAWASTEAGPWTNLDTIETRATFPAGDLPFDIAWAQDRLAAHDRSYIFRSALLEQLFELPDPESP